MPEVFFVPDRNNERVDSLSDYFCSIKDSDPDRIDYWLKMVMENRYFNFLCQLPKVQAYDPLERHKELPRETLTKSYDDAWQTQAQLIRALLDAGASRAIYNQTPLVFTRPASHDNNSKLHPVITLMWSFYEHRLTDIVVAAVDASIKSLTEDQLEHLSNQLNHMLSLSLLRDKEDTDAIFNLIVKHDGLLKLDVRPCLKTCLSDSFSRSQRGIAFNQLVDSIYPRVSNAVKKQIKKGFHGGDQFYQLIKDENWNACKQLEEWKTPLFDIFPDFMDKHPDNLPERIKHIKSKYSETIKSIAYCAMFKDNIDRSKLLEIAGNDERKKKLITEVFLLLLSKSNDIEST